MFLEVILANFPLILLVLALGLASFKWTGQALCRYLLLLPIGLGGLWGFIFHAFLPELSAEKIGWPNSPFQYEVAAANLGMGLAGLIGYWRSWDFSLATTLFATSFLWGAALVHLIEILFQENYASGNAGTILFTDLIIPFLLILSLSLWLQEKRRQNYPTD